MDYISVIDMLYVAVMEIINRNELYCCFIDTINKHSRVIYISVIDMINKYDWKIAVIDMKSIQEWIILLLTIWLLLLFSIS